MKYEKYGFTDYHWFNAFMLIKLVTLFGHDHKEGPHYHPKKFVLFFSHFIQVHDVKRVFQASSVYACLILSPLAFKHANISKQ